MMILLALIVCIVSANPTPFNGMVYSGWSTGAYSAPSSDISIQEMTQIKNNWVSVVWTWYQPTIDNTTIAPLQNVSPSSDDISHFVSTAKSYGLKVALKPHVDLSNDPSHWRGEIGLNFQQSQWDTWFASYQSFIYLVSKLAASLDTDLLIIGTELSVTESQVDLWRSTIQGIRQIFSGPLVYGANWSPFNVSWWDALDYIGIDAYFPLATEANPPVSTLVAGWQSPLAKISSVAQNFSKTVIFTEIGYESMASTATAPYGTNGPLNLMAQANCYEAFFQAVYTQSWFQGVFWWAWGVDPLEGGKCDLGYTPHNKPAEGVLQQYYGSSNNLSAVFGLYNVYKNGVLSSDWENWSYKGDINLQGTAVVYPGETYSISADLNATGAVSLHANGFSTTPYTVIVFFIAGASGVNNNVYISANNQNDQTIYSLSLANYVANCTVTPGWQSVSVPLADMQAASTTIVRINFQNVQDSPGIFYIDDINFM